MIGTFNRFAEAVVIKMDEQTAIMNRQAARMDEQGLKMDQQTAKMDQLTAELKGIREDSSCCTTTRNGCRRSKPSYSRKVLSVRDGEQPKP